MVKGQRSLWLLLLSTLHPLTHITPTCAALLMTHYIQQSTGPGKSTCRIIWTLNLEIMTHFTFYLFYCKNDTSWKLYQFLKVPAEPAAYQTRGFQTPRLRNSDVNSDADALCYQGLNCVYLYVLFFFVKYHHLMFVVMNILLIIKWFLAKQ